MSDFPLDAAEIAKATNGAVPAGDPRLPLLISGVWSGIRSYCGWHVSPVITETLTLDGKGGRFLKLPTLRLASVGVLKIDGKPIPAENYGVSKLGLIELYAGEFPRRYGSIEVTFTHGYETVPDVNQVATQIIVNALASPMGVTREQAGAVSISFATTAPGVSGGVSILERDKEILSRYKLEGI